MNFLHFVLALFALLPLSQAKLQNRFLENISYYYTNTRIKQVAQQCTRSSRSSIFGSYGLSHTTSFKKDFQSFFTLNTTLFDSFVNLEIDNVHSSLLDNKLGYATFIVPLIIGLILAIIIIPFLWICVCCPCQCCLRKNIQYTKCQKIWPAIILFILSLLVMAVAAAGIISNYKFYLGFQQTACGTIVALDDTLNGNSNYAQTSFFAGIKTLNTDLIALQSNSDIINGNLSLVSSNGSKIIAVNKQIQSALLDVFSIPNNNGNNLTLQYAVPLNTLMTNRFIKSTFPVLLGNYIDNNSLVGKTYADLNLSLNIIKAQTNSVDNYLQIYQISKDNLNYLINQTDKKTGEIYQSVLTFNDFLVKINPIQSVWYLQYLVYGIFGLFGFICLIGIVSFGCFGKMICRNMLYFSCFGYVFLGVISMSSALFLSYFTPIMYSGCLYAQQTTKNSNNFINSMEKLKISRQTASKYTVCLKSGNGDIVTSLGGVQTGVYLYSLKYAMLNITNLNLGAMANQTITSYNNLRNKVEEYSFAQTLDITDSQSLTILKKSSQPSQYACSASGFTQDSWIPSTNQTDSAIPCSVSSGLTANKNTCLNITGLEERSSGCVGCMNTFQLFQNYTYSDISTTLNNRYSNSDCQLFNNDLANIWSNFYNKKNIVLSPVNARTKTANVSVNQVAKSFNQLLSPLFSNTINNLYATSRYILDPKYGMVGGLDCRIIGQDLAILSSVICENTFSYSYFHRILTLILGYAILLSLCCISCTIFRRKKQIDQFNKPKKNVRVAAHYSDPITDARLHEAYL